MTTKEEYDFIVFIGRFSPFHSGHYEVALQALAAGKNLIFVIGSAYTSRNSKNPYTAQERKEIISSAFTEDELKRISFVFQPDHPYNLTRWLSEVGRAVQTIVERSPWSDFSQKVAIIGFDKDHSSFYLNMFPQWAKLSYVGKVTIHATDIRAGLFSLTSVSTGVPNSNWFVSQKHFDAVWKATAPIWVQISSELDHIEKYKRQWKVAPYPVQFNTVDAVIEQSAHVLLVKRKEQPGKGLWALPGGFLNEYETLLDGSIREVYEETKIDVPEKVLRGCLVSSQVFDYPYRSLRGRTITHAFHFKLQDRDYLPKVKGSDDAEVAVWVPISSLRSEDFFEDHYHIICQLLKI